MKSEITRKGVEGTYEAMRKPCGGRRGGREGRSRRRGEGEVGAAAFLPRVSRWLSQAVSTLPVSQVRHGVGPEGACAGAGLAGGAAGAGVLKREAAGQGSGSEEGSGPRGRGVRKGVSRPECPELICDLESSQLSGRRSDPFATISKWVQAPGLPASALAHTGRPWQVGGGTLPNEGQRGHRRRPSCSSGAFWGPKRESPLGSMTQHPRGSPSE